MLEKHLWDTLFLYLVVEILQLVHEISSFLEVLYKGGDLNIFLKFTDKHKKQSSGGVLSKDVLKDYTKFTEKGLCILKMSEDGDVHWRCSVKKVFLKRNGGVSEPAFQRSSTK